MVSRQMKRFGLSAGLILVGVVSTIIAGRKISEHGISSAARRVAPAKEQTELWHCGMHPQVIQDHPGQCPICHMELTPVNSQPMASMQDAGDPGAAGPEVRIDPTVVQNMGVRTATVVRGPLVKTIRAYGLLKLPEPGMQDVSLKVGGWIDKLYADQEGMHITQGAPLFDLYSPELQIAEQELISAVQSESSPARTADPALRDDAKKLVSLARQKLALWGVADRDIDAIAKCHTPPRDLPFRSPVSGHLEEKTIVQGSAVQPGVKLLRIADHSKLWLDAQVYQDQFYGLKVGQPVVADIDGMPEKAFHGTIGFIYPHFDQATRALMVRATLDNGAFELKPGMYATVQIITHPVGDDAVQVPREAVIDTGTRQIAFVVAGEGRFAPRKVRMGIEGDDDSVQILQGLEPGETVVTSGQFLMDVESRTIEATEKLTPHAGHRH